MAENYTLFEVSWEVCNMVGGIYTVISTKAQTLSRRFGDDYVAVGPWLLSDHDEALPFEEEAGFESFADSCRGAGLPVRIGRWSIPGRPRTILIDFSGLYAKKDDVLAELWEEYEVDSIEGQWDYVEPVLFGWSAGKVLERWWHEYLLPERRRGVAQFHEWMTGSGLLYLKRRTPGIGTVFTTHATMLGRAMSSTGRSPDDGLGEDTAADLAEAHDVVAKHSLEGTCAREADAFTTVSEITAKEAELFHERRPAPILPNGIDVDVIDELAGRRAEDEREAVRALLARTASVFLGEDVSDATFWCVSGRYEFHNKGIDVLLDALAEVGAREGPGRAVLFVLVPAGNSGVKGAVLQRLAEAADTPPASFDGPLGVSTHNLFDEEHDPVHEHCERLGLGNEPGSRVKVVQVPIYLAENDGFWNRSYEGILRAMDLSCFPSYYEPWGYTPQESLAVGVPTITTDYAGFGRWAESHELSAADGITVLPRVHREYAEVATALATELEERLAGGPPDAGLREACRRTAQRTAWSDLIASYDEAFATALSGVAERLKSGVPLPARPALPLAEQPLVDAAAPRLVHFDVAATLPPPLRGLERLARNFWWCWNPEARGLFAELSPRSWEAARHNPVVFLKRVYSEDLAQKAADPDYVARLEATLERFDAYLEERPEELVPGISGERPVAYFSAEFGVHESLRVYSGGLGVLAGDHLKSASDLGLPFVGVGLFYRKGYLSQRLSAEGEQIAVDMENVPADLPLECVLGPDGGPLEVRVQLPGREFCLRAWKAQVGRVPLYLMDANTPSNRPEDRDILRHLYGGDEKVRLLQEIVLGRGGVRLLRRLGVDPVAYHVNEGHPAFLSLERVSELVRSGLTFDEAREVVRATTAFTTHTPVPAGHDRFDEDLMRPHFSDVADWLGVPWERFFALGTSDADKGSFNMTYLAMSFASVCNGVSRLHAVASKRLLHPFWPKVLESEVPVGSVTNGIHLATWTGGDVGRLLGVEGRGVRGEDFEHGAASIADNALWKVRRAAKARLGARVSAAMEKSFVERHDSPILLTRMLDGLDEDALWIGFARRFAPYKRALLLFQDHERLRALLDDPDRPVRILVAGKAHPRDEHGKEILRSIAGLCRSEEFIGRVFLLENYEMELARVLVQGVDVWLNTPTRMLEASGTSGMKAAANGALNLSIADGWWPEAADGENGWTIGGERAYEDQELQDQLDSTTLYRLLEEEVVPVFFDRDGGDPPRAWLERVRHDLATIPPVFNTDRMVGEYADQAYRPLARAGVDLARDRHARAKERARERRRIARGFDRIKLLSVQTPDLSNARVGDRLDVRLQVELGELTPDDVRLELVLGHAKGAADVENRIVVPLVEEAAEAGATRTYSGSHKVERSGPYAYGIRVRARACGDPRDTLRHLVRWT